MSENNQEIRELDLNVDQSYSDEARIREAELAHDAKMAQLDFDRERYLAARPKSDLEVQLEYQYKNRQLDRQIANDQYERSWPRKAEKGGLIAAAVTGVVFLFKWLIGLADKE